MVDFKKLLKKKRAKVSFDSNLYFPNLPAHKEPYEEAQHYEDATPEEAIMMSRRGQAKGYDPEIFGRKWTSEIPVLCVATKRGVQWKRMSEAQKEWLKEVDDDPVRRKAREELIRRKNWTSWEDVTPANREFLMSLLWIPVDPYTEMEILARAAM